ncbi:MAG: preprotein translocase subunit SecY [Planctomycetes bacterium]|nr:preprotein translocase subunit SecY [Planctomycetota bacterium]
MVERDLSESPVRELVRRFLITILLGVVVYRFGVFVPIPGVDALELKRIVRGSGEGDPIGDILRYANMFNGGAIANASVFGLGIMPYISASIIMQLLTFSFPTLKALQKEGEGGRRKIQQYTRYATLLICLVQATMASVALYNFKDDQNHVLVSGYNLMPFVLQSALVITTGSMVLLWLAEQITKFGIGNGVSLIIMIGIIASTPSSFHGLDGDLGTYLLIAAISLSIIAAIVVVVRATRNIQLEQQRRIQGNKVYGGATTVLPLKLNQANVVPVIFASPVMVVLGYAAASPWLQFAGLDAFFGSGTAGYRYIFAGLIIAFTYFYISITFDLNEMSNHFKTHGFFVRGIKPGRKTVEYLQHHLTRITFVGAIFLAVIAILPQMLDSAIGLTGGGGAMLMGGTGLLIVVGVALDIMQKIASFFLAHQYRGLGGEGGDAGGAKAKRF